MVNRNSQSIGKIYEQEACRFLEKNGLHLLIRNYRCFVGEIDLIMQDDQDIVFVEVRSRTNLDFADALESVTYAKQQKIIKAAMHYLQQHHCIDTIACRFDVVGIMNDEIQWIKNAFSTEIFGI